MYCILGLCFLCKPVCVLEAGVGMSSGEEEKRLLGSAWAVGRRQCEEGATRFSRGQVTKEAASGERRSLGCSNFLGVCPIRHAHRGLWGVWTRSGIQIPWASKTPLEGQQRDAWMTSPYHWSHWDIPGWNHFLPAPGKLSIQLPHIESLCPKQPEPQPGQTGPLCLHKPNTPMSSLKPFVSECLPCGKQPQNLGDLSAVCCLQSPGRQRCHPGRPAILRRDYCSSVWSPARRHSSGWAARPPSGRVRIWPWVLTALHVFYLKLFSKSSRGYFMLVLAAVILHVSMLPVSSEAAVSTSHQGVFYSPKIPFVTQPAPTLWRTQNISQILSSPGRYNAQSHSEQTFWLQLWWIFFSWLLHGAREQRLHSGMRATWGPAPAPASSSWTTQGRTRLVIARQIWTGSSRILQAPGRQTASTQSSPTSQGCPCCAQSKTKTLALI